MFKPMQVAFPSAAVEAEQLILQEAPYTLGLGASGAHSTFRPLSLTICNATFLPATGPELDALEVDCDLFNELSERSA